jgi:hypothetical protein
MRAWWVALPVALAFFTLAACGGSSASGEVDDSDVVIEIPNIDMIQGDQVGLDADGFVPPDTTTDTQPEQAVEVEAQEGKLGWKCTDNNECESKYCIPSPGGQVCTEFCEDECPDGWVCKGIQATDVVFICVPRFATLCDPCTKHGDCTGNFTAEGNYCADLGSTAAGSVGKFCGGSCENAAVVCPTGYSCQEILVEGVAKKQCLPDSGSCQCSEWAKHESKSTTCTVKNEFGECDGMRTCTLAGLSACDAPKPEIETCNNQDDNCDGITDNITTPEGCNKSNEWGNCPGVIECSPGGNGACNAKDPAQDICDGIDNDCNGATDEDFPDTDADGKANCVDPDDDDDTILDELDKCPLNYDPNQEDFDGDGAGDACDTDDDNDGVPDASDCQPLDATVNPNAAEWCDSKDNNCNGFVDDGLCDDGNPCTKDVCHVDGPCTYENLTTPCDDQNICTEGDTCNGGACIGQAQKNCADGNPCTQDLCNPVSGCYNPTSPDYNYCEEGNLCTENDYCINGLCKSGTQKNCDDGNACTQESCAPSTGCVFAPAPAGTLCDDADACTVGDKCSGNECTHGAPYNCNTQCASGLFIGTCADVLGMPVCLGFCSGS